MLDSQIPRVDFHEGHWDEDEFSEALDIALGEEFLHGKADLVNVTSGAVHIGSATTHLALTRLVLRKGGRNLSSKSVVKTKQVFYESPVIATPFGPDGQLEGPELKAFLERCYDEARLVADLIQTGAVVVSGRAAEARNRAVLDNVFAREKERFLFISERSNLQGMLAALGAGAVEKSGSEKKRVLNIDLGAEGIRMAWVASGSFENFYSTRPGARALVLDEQGKLRSLDETGRLIAKQLKLDLEEGKSVTRSDKQAMGRFLAEALLDYLESEGVTKEGKIVFPSDPPALDGVDFVQFSGGVAEYVYGYESQPGTDLGFDWGSAIRKRAPRLGVKMGVLTPASRLRATPVGAATYSVQLPQESVFCSHGHLHGFKNLMVVSPKFPKGLRDPAAAAREVQAVLSRFNLGTGAEQPFALSVDYAEEAESHEAAASGLTAALRPWRHGFPLVLLGENDGAARIARMMAPYDADHADLIGLGGVHSHDLDFIDIGELGHGSEVPVLVRSLVFR